jgi:hypothetical protein
MGTLIVGDARPEMRQRPLIGGVFGRGQYALATMPVISRGLHAVRYLVIEPREGAVLAIGEDKRECLAAARRLLKASHAPAVAATWQQSKLFVDDDLMPVAAPSRKLRSLSRRRREIFEKCSGRCFYCSTPLTLDGRWHVEHQHPRALGGTDEPLNLVAACAPCNLAKRDRTALEYVMDQDRA